MSLPPIPANGENPWGDKLRAHLAALDDKIDNAAETDATASLTRGAATTIGTLTLTAQGKRRTLTAVAIRAAGTSTALGTLAAADRPPSDTLANGLLVAGGNAWGVLVKADGTLTLTATPPAATLLSGVIEWRTA